MNIKPLTRRSLAVLLTAILLLVAIPVTAVLAAQTAETVPTGLGFYNSWTGDYTLVDEGTASAACTGGDYILSATINQRESVSIPLSALPNGSTITDVNVIVEDRGDTATGGTYRTFVRLNGTNSADSVSHSVTGTSGACTGSINDAFDVTDTVKSGATTLEVGVVKGNATGVRVGVLSATITYTPAPTTTTVTSDNNPSTYGSSVTLTAAVSPSAATGTVEFYNGAALLGTGTLSSGTATLSTSALTASASPYSITAKYLGTSSYAASTSAAISQVVNKANAACDVSGFSGVYDGSAHGAGGSCTGDGTLDLGSAFTNVPGGTAHWIFTGDSNYNDQSGDVAITIDKAEAVIVVTPYSVTYDGYTYTSTGTATGVNDEDLSDGLDLIATSHTDAGSYTGDAWIFTSPDPNYKDASGTVDNAIAKAEAVIVVDPYTVTYDGSAHVSAGTALGVEEEDLSTGLDLSATSHTNAGSYTGDAWIFTAPNANYNDASGTVDNNIAKADALISVTPYSVTYDGSEHSSTGTALGVEEEDLSGGLDLSATSHTNAGLYAGDAWTFTDVTGNYRDASGTVDNSIAKAEADCSSVAGYSVTYDGSAHTATGSCLGVGSEGTLAGLDLSATSHTDIGAYTDDPWTFTDVTGNYKDASGTVNDLISAKLVPALSLSGGPFTYDGSPHAAAVSGSVAGTVSNIQYDGSATVPTNAGTYAVTADFLPDDAVTYETLIGASAGNITIDKAAPDCSSIAGYSVAHDGNPHTAAGSCQGVGSDGTLAGLDLTATTHTAVGTYIGDPWTFTDVTGNYEDASGTVDSSINDATPPVVNSVVRVGENPTSASGVDYTVTFSESVTGVTADDFRLFTSGIAGASVSGVSGSGSVYTVSVNTGAGNGKLRLDVMKNGSIKDGTNNPLAAVFNNGEVYQVLKGAATVGVFRPSNGIIYLKNANTTGNADISINYGMGGDKPVTGDWNGDGVDTIGVYRGNTFYLRNSNSVGNADVSFVFGMAGDQPVAGDWNGDGIDTIGVYRSSTFTFYLRNSNSAGAPDMQFSLGIPGDIGITGDWDGDGKDTTGVFRPSNGIIYLKNANTTGNADIGINYGMGGDKPVTGDWDNDGIDTIGVLRGNTFYLRNSNTVGNANVSFALGLSGDLPIAGNWDGKP